MKKINIAILDDHQIVIDGLKLLLENDANINVLLESTNGFTMLEMLKNNTPKVDIILLDLMMPVVSGYESAMMIKNHFPDIGIVILSMSNDAEIIYNLIEGADIKGFIPKSVNKSELINAIIKVYEGGIYFSDEILTELALYKSNVQQKEELTLSAREVEIINLISKGCTNKEIASQLYISELTVATHRKNIFRKTNTHNVGQLIEFSNKFKLIK